MAVPPIGSVLTPSGFIVLSAEGQVVLNWNYTPLATTFYINRSTDNTTFTNIGQTSALEYSDSTGVVGTLYYYQLQAATVSFSSNPTLSVTGQSLNPGETTVGNIMLESKQRCDKVNTENITQQEWVSMINQSYKELYDILIQKFADEYYVATPYSYTTSQDLQLYPLPTDFYKLLLVECALNPGDQNSWVTLREFQFIQKNLYNYPNVYTFYGITNLRYRLTGTNLNIVPVPQGGQTIRIWYAPRPSQLISLNQTVDGVSGWEEYIVADVCRKAMIKEESDSGPFAQQKGELMKRIEEAAENRNIGEPERVSDSKLRNFSWFDPGDSNGCGY